jgi:hypothetical protein
MSIDQVVMRGERITETIPVTSDGIDYDVHVLERDGLHTGDEVLLDIRSTTEKLVLIDGNPLELKIAQGAGRVVMIDLATGDRSEMMLSQGDEAEVSAHNTLYWYENTGDESFIVRDHCDAFDPAHEPTAAEVAERLVGFIQAK